jgi:protein SCO1/2
MINPLKVCRRVLACGVFLIASQAFAAEGGVMPESTIDPGIMQIDEAAHLGERLPKELAFQDAGGQRFTLGDVLGKPVILVMSYYTCDGSCPTMNQSLMKALRRQDRFQIGKDFRVLTVSFDKNDSMVSAQQFIAKAHIPENMRDGWKMAVSAAGETGIQALSSTIGSRYFWSRADQVFMHPNALVFLTPEGRVARYIYGTRVDGDAVKLALIDADWGKIANSTQIADILSAVCFSYNFKEGRYTPNYSAIAGLCSLVFGVALVILSTFVFKRKKLGGLSHVS